MNISLSFPSGVSFHLLGVKDNNVSLFFWVKLERTLHLIELKIPTFHPKRSCLPNGSLKEWYGGQNEWFCFALFWIQRVQLDCSLYTMRTLSDCSV